MQEVGSERLLYASQPNWRAAWPQHLITFLFAVFWNGVTLPIAALVAGSLLGLVPAPAAKGMTTGVLWVIALFLLPFLAIGVATLLAPLLSWRAQVRTVHAITDRRILTLVSGRALNVVSCARSAIKFVRCRRLRPDGSGSLSIGYGVERDSDGDARPLTQEWPGVLGARRAEELLMADWAARPT